MNDAENPKRRNTHSKEEKRQLAEQATAFAKADSDARRQARDQKSARLKAMRLAAEQLLN